MYVENSDVNFVLSILEKDVSREYDTFNYAYLCGKLDVLRELGIISFEQAREYEKKIKEGEFVC